MAIFCEAEYKCVPELQTVMAHLEISFCSVEVKRIKFLLLVSLVLFCIKIKLVLDYRRRSADNESSPQLFLAVLTSDSRHVIPPTTELLRLDVKILQWGISS